MELKIAEAKKKNKHPFLGGMSGNLQKYRTYLIHTSIGNKGVLSFEVYREVLHFYILFFISGSQTRNF